MAAWDSNSILRSIQRYFAAYFPNEWEVRTKREGVSDDHRPVAVIQLLPASASRGRAAIDQGNVEQIRGVTVHAFPSIKGGEDAAERRANDLAEDLFNVLQFGLDLRHSTTDRHVAGPWRIPLWDYTGVPDHPGDDEVEVDPHDVLWVAEGAEITSEQDPDDPLRWMVRLSFRVSVERPGRVGPVGPLVDDVPGVWVGTGSV